MSDTQPKTLTLSAVTGSTTLRDTAFSTEGMRDLIFQVEVSASASGGSDTLTVTIQHTNTDLTTAGGSSSDNYWLTYVAFTAIVGNASVPSVVQKNMIDASGSTYIKPIGRWCRIKYVTADVSGSSSFTGKIRVSNNIAVTE